MDNFKAITVSIETLDAAILDTNPSTRRHAELILARHHLLDALYLITTGRLTPEDLLWSTKVEDLPK